MKIAAPRRVWRPLRCFVILLCAGGAVLAADNSWRTDLRFDFAASDWWSNISPAEMPSADIAVASDPVGHSAPQLSMSELLHGLLFSKPSTGWRLAPEKTDFASAWMTQQSGDTVSSVSRNDYWPSSFSPVNFIASSGSAGSTAPGSSTSPSAVTATGTWISLASGNWSTPGNWSGGIVADGAGNDANFDTLDITSDVTVSLDPSRTVGNLYIGDTDGTNRYTIAPVSGTTLTFDSGVASTAGNLSQTSTSAGDTISANIFFKNDLDVGNRSTTNPFTINGDIASSQPNSFQNLSFNSGPNDAGEIRVTGKISNGTTGTSVSVGIYGGTVIFSGDNSYKGSTFVSDGTLLVNGNSSAATGFIQVGGGGAVLGGTGTVGGTVFLFNGTITGGTTTGVGTLTLLKNVSLDPGEGGGGTYLANIFGSTSDLLSITGTLTLGTNSSLVVSGMLDGTTTYTIATFSDLVNDAHFGSTSGIPANYMLVYNDLDIELVPTAIPEPATWIGGALGLGVFAFARRKRKTLRS